MNIFVGNLAFTATVDEVRQLFEAYGDVASVQLLTDRETGRPRGYGFVEMPDATQAQAAIAGLTEVGNFCIRPSRRRHSPQARLIIC
jgi:RNA recognition motif-containing protein